MPISWTDRFSAGAREMRGSTLRRIFRDSRRPGMISLAGDGQPYDGPVIFDSGELGNGGPPTANRVTWTIPDDLDPGTYTYFCRIHPMMRGAFRVED